MQLNPECNCQPTHIKALETLEIKNRTASSRISRQGAQMLEWVPENHEKVLWLSEGAKFEPECTIRGGLPVCWPYFASHPFTDDAPFHGFARRKNWTLQKCETDGDNTTVEYHYANDEIDTYWPHPCAATLRYDIGEKLSITLQTHNTGYSPFRLSQAFHTYFHVGDIGAVEVEGLENCKFIDTLQNNNIRTEDTPITINQEIDRIYQEQNGTISIIDKKLNRKIQIEGEGISSVIVWNPWIAKSRRLGDMGPEGSFRQMLCIETANVRENSIYLQPQETYTLSTIIDVQKL